MIFWLALSVTLPLLIGVFLVHLLWPSHTSLRSPLLVKCFLALGLGFGVSSGYFFLWLLAFGPPGGNFIIAETVLGLCLAAVFLYLVKKRDSSASPDFSPIPNSSPTLSRIVAAAFYVAFALTSIVFIIFIWRQPHGQFDATAIWNMRARFIFRGGAHWTDAFSNALSWSHPDYPLLLPLSITRCWAYVGKDLLIAPALLAVLFTLATVGLLVSSVALLRSRSQGFLAGLVLLGPFLFVRVGISEYADTPLSFYLLAVLVLLCLQDRTSDNNYSFLVLAGLMAGLATWTKNEGWLFVVSIIGARFAVIILSKGLKVYLRQMLSFSAGLIPILLIVVYFKMRLAPPNNLVAAQELAPAGNKLLDFHRYALILKACFTQFAGFDRWYLHPAYLLFIYPWLLGMSVNGKERAGLATSAVALSLILTGYFFIYVTSPYDLNWHLNSSLDRLLIQLWPSFVLIYFLTVRTPEQALNHQLNARG